MSWFKHKPPKHPPLSKSHQHPFHSSPMAEKALKETKNKVSGKGTDSENKNNPQG